ncbi:MAG TPA: family 16 glycosylhydrolase [Verrucomicrobiae bacterium]|nr:family 16 glycosylhydrolase [Verrucomicrobiae bacterium]
MSRPHKKRRYPRWAPRLITPDSSQAEPQHMSLNRNWIGILRPAFPAAVAACIIFAIGLLFAMEAGAANVLTNPGFETSGLAGWTTFGPYNYDENTPGLAHSGTNFYKVYGAFNASQNYTGIYQDNLSAPGAVYSADGWAYTLGSDGGGIHGEDAIWLEVSFRDASYNALALYRSVVVTSNNLAKFGGTNTWFDLHITNECSFTNASAPILLPGTATNSVASLVAPAGTAYVRYQVVFAQGPDNANGSMYFDDLNLNKTGGAPPPATQWNIVWSDEFNSNSINPNIWTFETGNGCPNLCGWGNNESEYYTSRTNNAYESGGLLHIVVRKEATNGCFYTSARMKTEGLYSTPVYGRFEWRAKLPAGVGMWPGLWMLGSDFSSVGWPDCGEIDVVESNGDTNNFVQGSLHSGNGDETAIYTFPAGQLTSDFHTYLLDWEANSIQWYVDGQLYETQSGGAPFNAPFFLLMNVAVGGNYVGNPTTNSINAGTVFPQELQVDYVRILELTAPLQITTTRSNGNVVLTWPTNIVCHLQVQTNSLTGGNWSDLVNSTSPFVIRPSQNTACVFYRLESP